MNAKRFENRLNKDNVKFNTLNPVWDNKKKDALNVFEMIDLLNDLSEEIKYLQGKSSSWKITASEQMFESAELMKQIVELKEENEQLKLQYKELEIILLNNQLAYNALEKENYQLKKDLIDHSALISMLEDYQALKIEETLWNLTGAKSEEEFNELYKPYLNKAKRCWR